jgi:cholestenol delta-isomerase
MFSLSSKDQRACNADDLIAAGSLHCLLEGYFITHHSRMGPAQDLFGQLWKEYAKSDSRYLISDPFVVSVETITVVS